MRLPTSTLRLACALASLALASLALAACSGGDESASDTAAVSSAPVLALDTARVRVATPTDTLTLTVELAKTDEQKQLGLMERRSLGDTSGMLFLYDATQSGESGFWMYRTRIPLDIAFVDSAGTIRSITTMQPCTSDMSGVCPTYPAGAPYRAALEVNAGFFARHGVKVGHVVVLGDTAK